MRSFRGKQYHNIGGNWYMLWLPVKDIAGGLPLWVDRPFNDLWDLSSINLNTTAWFGADHTRETLDLELDEDETPNGPLYKSTVSLIVAKDYNERRMDFDDMENHRFVVAIFDNNNKGTLFGHTNQEGEIFGMKFKKKKPSNPTYKGLNRWELRFYMESHVMPFDVTYVTGPVVDPGPGGGNGQLDPPTGPAGA